MDRLKNLQGNVVNPAISGVAASAGNADGNVSFSDSQDLPKVAYGLRIENIVDGDTLKVDLEDGTTCKFTLKEFEHGWHPINVKKIYATGTTATLKIFAGR